MFPTAYSLQASSSICITVVVPDEYNKHCIQAQTDDNYRDKLRH